MIMFLDFKDGNCPICGVSGDADGDGAHDCPNCGAKFSDIGILTAPQKKPNLDWN